MVGLALGSRGVLRVILVVLTSLATSCRSAKLDFHSEVKKVQSEFKKGKRAFTLEYHSYDGDWIGEVPENETLLRVQGNGAASLFRRSGSGYDSAHPSGRFSGTLSEEALSNFLRILAEGQLQDVPREHHGPTEPICKFQLRTKDTAYSFSWGFSHGPDREGVRKIESILDSWVDSACRTIQWNLLFSVKTLSLEKGRLTGVLQLENLGSEPIRLFHPGSPGQANDFGIRLTYGETPLIEEGYTPAPIERHYAAIHPGNEKRPSIIEISRGQPFVLDFSVPLEARAPRGYIGHFKFVHRFAEDSLEGKPIFNGTLTTSEQKW